MTATSERASGPSGFVAAASAKALGRSAGAHILRLAFLIFTPAALVALSVMGLLYREQTASNRAVAQARQENAAEIGRTELDGRLAELAADAGYLAASVPLTHWLAGGGAASLQDLERELLAFASHRPQYDQVRFIGIDGKERVRVDRTDGSAVLVPAAALQDKAGRSYVTDTLKLGRGEIYFSRFDLNVEHGAVEQPIKPMIRVATPVFDAAGEKRGMIILNYRGAELLSHLRALGQQMEGDIWLIDSDGNWMLGPSEADDWAFMFPEQRGARTFGGSFPDAWQALAAGQGETRDDDGTLFGFSAVHAGNAGQTDAPMRTWYLVRHLGTDEAPPVLTAPFLIGCGAIFFLLAASALGTAIYLTRRQQAQSEIALLNRRLAHSEKMEALGQLTGGVAHDFNNLLAVIIGHAEILTETVDDPELKEIAEHVMLSAEKGSLLTERLLAIGRRQALHPVDFGVGEALDSLGATLHRSLGDGITLQVATDAGARLHVDRAQLESALVNLALNAAAAMPSGGVFTVATSPVDDAEAKAVGLKPGRFLRMSVSDTGTGMDADTAAHAFDPFFSSKTFGKGSGMGLAMVYGFVRQSGGEATIDSAPGAGTRIDLYLPLAAEAVETAETEAPVAAPQTASEPPVAASNVVPLQTRGSQERVLMVEDEPRLRAQIARLLGELGYLVEEAESGLQALSILRTNPNFDLLFTDVVMPGGVSGIDLAKRARQLRPQLKVLLTTGYADAAAEQLASIRDPIIRKPYRRRYLEKVVRDVLGRAA